MAATPTTELDVIDKFGPHLAYSVGTDPRAAAEPDRLVKTHCCFCGQQCGIQLKVRGNQVIGFEPWEEFPFNHGMVCPQGVTRDMQGGRPDRLLDPLMRTPQGFQASSWQEALDFTARRLQEIQE